MRGRLRASSWCYPHHAPGPGDRKHLRSSRRCFPSRGSAGTRISVEAGREGGHPFDAHESATMDARVVSEEGNLYPPRHAASHAGRGEILRSGALGSLETLPSFQPVFIASEGWVGSPPASDEPTLGGPRRVSSSCPCRRGGVKLRWVSGDSLPFVPRLRWKTGLRRYRLKRVDHAGRSGGWFARGEDRLLVGSCSRIVR